MKPNPLSSLNHLTVPVAIVFPPASIVLRTRRLLSKSYDRWHRDVGRIARPDLATVAALKISARLTPGAGSLPARRLAHDREVSPAVHDLGQGQKQDVFSISWRRNCESGSRIA